MVLLLFGRVAAEAAALFFILQETLWGDDLNLSKAMEEARALKLGYEVSDEMLRSHINDCEMMILNSVVSGREGDAAVLEIYKGVDNESAPETELFAPAPFERIYAQYCAAQIDLMYEDGGRYINDAVVFRDTFAALKRHWWKNHRQIHDYYYHN